MIAAALNPSALADQHRAAKPALVAPPKMTLAQACNAWNASHVHGYERIQARMAEDADAAAFDAALDAVIAETRS